MVRGLRALHPHSVEAQADKFESRTTMSNGTDINLFLIDMTELPAVGPAHMIIRTKTEDRDLVATASKLLGLSQAQFLRGAVVATAKKVIQEKRDAR